MLPNFLEDIIKNIAKREGYVTFEIEAENILKNGSSYMGDLFTVKIKGKSGESDKETNIFVKKIILNEFMPDNFSINVAYQNELFAHKELFKIYAELQEEYKVPMEERFKMAKYFDESNEDVIILDNLTREGFKTYNRLEDVSLKFVELSVQELAKFHALSFALQTIRPAYCETNIMNKRSPFIWNESRNYVGENLSRCARATIENLDDEVIKKKMEEFIPGLFERYLQYIYNTSEIPCLCHGDYRPLNIMVKEINGCETEVIPVDYQFVHYGCPVNDLIFCLFSGTTSHIRLNHMDHLKELYYSTLVNFSKHFDINMVKMFSRTKFEEIFEKRLNFGLIVATVYAPLDYGIEKSVLNMESKISGTFDLKFDDKFQERYVGVVKNFIEWGYI